MGVPYDRKIDEVGQCLLSPLRWQFSNRYVPPQDLRYFEVEQMRSMNELSGFKEPLVNIGCGTAPQEPLQNCRSVGNYHRLSRSSRII